MWNPPRKIVEKKLRCLGKNWTVGFFSKAENFHEKIAQRWKNLLEAGLGVLKVDFLFLLGHFSLQQLGNEREGVYHHQQPGLGGQIIVLITINFFIIMGAWIAICLRCWYSQIPGISSISTLLTNFFFQIYAGFSKSMLLASYNHFWCFIEQWIALFFYQQVVFFSSSAWCSFFKVFLALGFKLEVEYCLANMPKPLDPIWQYGEHEDETNDKDCLVNYVANIW